MSCPKQTDLELEGSFRGLRRGDPLNIPGGDLAGEYVVRHIEVGRLTLTRTTRHRSKR